MKPFTDLITPARAFVRAYRALVRALLGPNEATIRARRGPYRSHY